MAIRVTYTGENTVFQPEQHVQTFTDALEAAQTISAVKRYDNLTLDSVETDTASERHALDVILSDYY